MAEPFTPEELAKRRSWFETDVPAVQRLLATVDDMRAEIARHHQDFDEWETRALRYQAERDAVTAERDYLLSGVTIYELEDDEEGEGTIHMLAQSPQVLARVRERVARMLARAGTAEAALAELRQACWDAYVTLGFDTDGDPTPAAVVDLPGLVRSMAIEARRDYDEAMRR